MWANINQGTSNNIVYVSKMGVATEPVAVNHIQFTLSGTHDANDLVTIAVYFNATAPVFSGSSFLGSAAATFAAPHLYSIAISRSMATGSTGYFMIVANLSSTATDNKTIKINGATSPIVFGFTTAPNIINTQTDAAGIQTIHAAGTSLITSISSAYINQETNIDITDVNKDGGIVNSSAKLNPHCSYTGGEASKYCVSFFLSSSLCTTDFLLVKGLGFISRMD